MNVYLEKIANKVELEPGVHYDLAKHEMKISQGRISEHMRDQDTFRRRFTGGLYGGIGASLGHLYGDAHGNRLILESTGGFDLKKRVIPTAEGSSRVVYDQVLLPAKNNLYSKLSRKMSPKSFRTATRTAGSLIGGLGLGGLGYAVGGTLDVDKPTVKNKFISSLERKHQKTIDQLEGWD